MYFKYFLVGLLIKLIQSDYIVKSIKFAPGTDIFKDSNGNPKYVPQRDGIVLVTLDTGEVTTICNYNFNEKNADVVCKTLGYPANGYSIMTGSNETGSVLIGNFDCTGNETHLQQCLHSGRIKFTGACGEHKRDVHVFCLEPKIEPEVPTIITTCSKLPEYRLEPPNGTKWINSGYFQINHGGTFKYVCNEDADLQNEFAKYYCGKMCTNPNIPQVILPPTSTPPSNLQYVILNSASPYGIKSTKASCRPGAVIALQCGDEIQEQEKSPNVTCSNKEMILTWGPSHVPYINDSLVKTRIGCPPLSTTYSTANGLTIIIKLENITLIESNANEIFYKCILDRTYDSSIHTPKVVQVKCILPKVNNDTGTIKFINVTAIPITAKFDIISIMKFYNDKAFLNQMIPPYSVSGDKYLNVKVTLQNPPDNVQLVLRNCFVTNDRNNPVKKEMIIENGCPLSTYDANIYPLDKASEGFQFKPSGMANKLGSNNLYVVCEGMKCLSKNDNDCKYCGDTKRRKRSVVEYIDIPVVYKEIYIFY